MVIKGKPGNADFSFKALKEVYMKAHAHAQIHIMGILALIYF